jgi:hypothetical protein
MYTVKLDLLASEKLKLYVANAEGEISGFAKVELDRFTDSFIVKDVVLLKQESGFANTVLDEKAISEFTSEIIKQGGDPSEYRCWWHSHGEMETFWSGTDTATIDSLDLDSDINNWWLSLVTNKKGDFKSRIDVFSPVRYTVEDLEVETDYNLEEFVPKLKQVEEILKDHEELKTVIPTIMAMIGEPDPTLEEEIIKEISEKVSIKKKGTIAKKDQDFIKKFHQEIDEDGHVSYRENEDTPYDNTNFNDEYPAGTIIDGYLRNDSGIFIEISTMSKKTKKKLSKKFPSLRRYLNNTTEIVKDYRGGRYNA